MNTQNITKWILLVAGAIFVNSYAHAAELNVPAQYSTIQAAIDAASNGDTVWVSDGTYMGSGNRDIDFTGKAITVRSINGPGVTIIDCEGTTTDPHRGFFFHSNETASSVLDGFTIKNGYGPPAVWTSGTWSVGGGIYSTNSSPLIINNIILGNTAQYGAGIQCWNHASPTISYNIIRNNTASVTGGGIYLYNNSSSTLDRNQITDNSALLGGGVAIDMSSPVVLTNNLIVRNLGSSEGGGLYCGNSSPSITNNTIAQNASASGGGAYFYYATPTTTNCILWGDTGGEIAGLGSTITVSYSDIAGVDYPGTGNISADPLFRNPGSGDYRLQSTPTPSPCINTGDPNPIYNDPDGSRNDMGAYGGPNAGGPLALVAYYPFNGNANDASGYGNNGTLGDVLIPNLAPVLTEDRYGTANSAYVFDGVNDFIHASDNVNLDFTGGITIAAWIYPYETKTQEIVHKGPENITPYSLALSESGDVVFSLTLAGDTVPPTQVRKSGYDLTRWTFVVGTYDGASMKLYIDGVLANTKSDTRSMTQNNSELLIGTRLNLVADTFNGKLDEIRIYNRALMSEEIMKLYTQGAFIKNINPNQGVTGNSSLSFTLDGANFQLGATVHLTNFVLLPSGQTSIDATNVAVSPPNQIIGDFDLTGAVIGQYDVVVTNPDGQSAALPRGFAVLGPPVTTAFPVGGTYNAPLNVTLSANEPATIRYSTNGSDFSAYTGPVNISSDTNLIFYATDAAGNTENYKTEVYTIDNRFAGTVAPTTRADMILPFTSTFTFLAGTQTFPVDCQKVNHTLTDSNGNPLPITDYLKVYVIPDDVITYATTTSVSVTCDLAQLYPPSVLVAGDYTLQVNYSSYFEPQGLPSGVTLFKGSISADPIPVTVTSPINTHIITTSVVSAGGNIYLAGSIVSGPVRVAAGSSPTFTITPNTGGQIWDVRVDGASYGPIPAYTFTPVTTDDHTIAASFSAFSGFFSPVDNLPAFNVVKAGAAIPVKFSLGGNLGLDIFAAGYPTSSGIGCSSTAPQDTIEQTVTAGKSSLSYDSVSDQYIYVWKTDPKWAGTCRKLEVKLADGISHYANFNFTK